MTTPIGFICHWQTRSRTLAMPIPLSDLDEAWAEVLQLLNSDGNLIVWEIEHAAQPHTIHAVVKDAIDSFYLVAITDGAALCQDQTQH